MDMPAFRESVAKGGIKIWPIKYQRVLCCYSSPDLGQLMLRCESTADRDG